MTSLNLGQLESVDLRTVWSDEAGDFTPWLAQEQNLALLGETVGIELELEAQEKDVGPFRADILCKDTTTDNWVLIENQLERTDHNHLGQLLTYAAGLKAVTIIWIAQRFTDEHRAALDWLNEITDDRFNFFGLEVQLWRIGQSPVAPAFDVVCKPNEWSRTISGAANRMVESEVSDTRLLYRDYWAALVEHLDQCGSTVRMKKPQPQTWMTFPVGRSNFYLTASISKQKKTASVCLIIYGAEHVPYFDLLAQEKGAIEEELGDEIEWRRRPEGKESHVCRPFENMDPENRDDWPRQHDLLRRTLEQFRASLVPRVKALDLAEYDPEAVAANEE